MTLSTRDLDDLYYAATLLENPGLAVKITNIVGVPIERVFALLPAGWNDVVRKSTKRALETAVNTALFTLQHNKKGASADKLHTLMAAGLGAVGGFWGLAGLGVELPVSTTVMMRSVADIARSEEHDLKDPAVKIACLEVFALGGTSGADDGAETGYFALRAALAKNIADAVRHIVAKGLTEKSAPALVRLMAQVSSRFGLQVTEKVAAQSLPLLGALGGAAINSLFIDHFQTMARGHFIILRLEKKYGSADIQAIYNTLKL